MKKILLVVDVEEQYLTDDDYMGLLDMDVWSNVREELREDFDFIIKKVAEMKNEGYEIHFTGETEPYGNLKKLVDVRLPYWGNSQTHICNTYGKDEQVFIVGLFRERCVHAVNMLIPGSQVIEGLCISHWVIGDNVGDFYDYNFSHVA